MRAVRGQAVRANTGATVQAKDVLFILLCILVNYTSVEELLPEKSLKPSRKKIWRNHLKNQKSMRKTNRNWIKSCLPRRKTTNTKQQTRTQNPPSLVFPALNSDEKEGDSERKWSQLYIDKRGAAIHKEREWNGASATASSVTVTNEREEWEREGLASFKEVAWCVYWCKESLRK